MSKQRRTHPTVVIRQKHNRRVRNGLCKPGIYTRSEYMAYCWYSGNTRSPKGWK